MIILFDANSYDKLLELSPEFRHKIFGKITKVILPQAVREQLDLMIKGEEEKRKKLSEINQIIAKLDIDDKLERVAGRFGDERYFSTLPNKMKNSDKEIALTAKREEAIMITNDGDCLIGLTRIGQRVLSFEDFLNVIESGIDL